MTAEQAAEAQESADSAAEGTRERSTIGFPYGDLNDASEVARGIHQVGGASCEIDQLAAHLEMTPSGGGFRQRLLTAKTFGLVSYGRETITLTTLGSRIVDSRQERAAGAQAFLTVPLYKQVYEQFKGGVLPPADALENAMMSMGVARKVKDKARQTFQRAAQQAGFFWAGTDRLVMPKGTTPAPHGDPEEGATERGDGHADDAKRKSARSSGGGSDDGGGRHPFIAGLLKELPPEGAEWTTEERRKWLQAAAMIFDLIYKNGGNGKSLRIDIESAK